MDRVYLEYKKQWENDWSIMEGIISINGINKWHLEAANMCRIYKRAIMILDIANNQGTAIPMG